MTRGDAVTPAVCPEWVRDTEEQLLGAMLVAPAAATEAVATGLSSDAFYPTQHRLIYEAIVDLQGRGEHVDPNTVAAALAHQGRLKEAGGHPRLTTLAMTMTHTAHAASWARLVQEAAIKRERVSALQEALDREATGADTSGAYERLRAAVTTRSSGRLQIKTLAELAAIPAPGYLLEPFIASPGLTILFGATGSYKTFIAIDWACTVATGAPYGDAAVAGRPVIYVCAEGRAGVAQRATAWASLHHQAADIPNLWYIDHPVNLLDPRQVNDLIATAKQLCGDPALIVFDTTARCMAGGDENSTSDANKLTANVDQIVRETNTSVLLTHHSGHEQTQRARGASAFSAAADQIIQVAKQKSNLATLRCTKAKDSEAFASVSIELVAHGGSLVVDPQAATRRLDRAVLEAVAAHDGICAHRLKTVLGVSWRVVDDATKRLQARRRIESEAGPRNATLWRASQQDLAEAGEVEPGALVRPSHSTPTTPVGGRGGGEVTSTPPTPTGEDENADDGQRDVTGGCDRSAA